MTESSAEALSEPQSLAHLLEFLARLENKTEVKEKVIEEILKKVKDYITGDLGKFATGGGSTGYLPQTIDKSKELRSNILKMDGTYKHYETAFNDSDANKYVKHLIDNIFPLFGCLYYMYYECNDNCVVIYGNEWHDERCNGSSGEKYLNNWLLNATGTERIIARGFKQDDLSDKKGECLFPKSESAPLLDYLQGAQLQSALFFMLFLPHHTKWNNAQSGHAVLFLEAFCKMASENKFNGQYTEANEGTFKQECQEVSKKISTLTTLKIIAPVAADNTTVKYEQLLTPDHFSKYIEWLKDNLQGLIKSLTEMKNDASNWNYTELVSSETFGPYPWGFTFKDQNWEQKKGQLQQQLEQQVSQLTEALESFRKKLQSLSATQSKGQSEKAAEKSSVSSASTVSTTSASSTNSGKEPSSSTDSTDSTDSNDSTNSAGSTLGSVIGGLGGLGATGAAAYAGSGFLGSVAEGIGKFFKGLFF